MPDKSQLKSAAPVVMDRVFVISALANLVAAYNLAITGHLLLLIQLSGSTPSDLEDGYVASAAILGAVFGQVAFGYLGMSKAYGWRIVRVMWWWPLVSVSMMEPLFWDSDVLIPL